MTESDRSSIIAKFLYHLLTIGQLKGDKTLGEIKDEVL
jgi:hypothetical protein